MKALRVLLFVCLGAYVSGRGLGGRGEGGRGEGGRGEGGRGEGGRGEGGRGGQSKIVVDHDAGADDAMAIFMALIYEQYFNGPKVIALTTTHANVPEDQAFINTELFLDIAGRRDVPIYRGSNFSLVIDVPSDGFFGRDGLGDLPASAFAAVEPIEAQPLHAALALIKLTKQYPGEISVVALGAMTNIALAIRLDPDFLNRVSTLYVAVGRERPYPNYNIANDVEAYHIIAQNAIPEKVTNVAYVQTANISTEWRKTVLGSINTTTMHYLNEFERVSSQSDEQQEEWYFLDPIVMAAALNDVVVQEVLYSQNSVNLCGEQRGMLVNNFTTQEGANVKVIHGIDTMNYMSLLYSIFAAEEQ